MSDGSPTRHASSQQLYAYWQGQRDGRPAPLRSAIEPVHFAKLLGDTFLLDASRTTAFPFRLAGTGLCANFGRELTGNDFLSIWQGADRDTLATTLRTIAQNACVAVVEIAGRTERGNTAPIEMLLMPVSQDGRHNDRILGLFSPLERPYWLGMQRIVRQQVLSLRWLEPEVSVPTATSIATRSLPALSRRPEPARPTTPAQPAGRRHHHLVVLDGGRD
jgi:hypothetical protein